MLECIQGLQLAIVVEYITYNFISSSFEVAFAWKLAFNTVSFPVDPFDSCTPMRFSHLLGSIHDHIYHKNEACKETFYFLHFYYIFLFLFYCSFRC
jgi:hypothetical protein